MKPLSDTQHAILTVAAERPRNLILPLPDGIKGGAAQKVVSGLVSRGLAIEIEAKPGDPMCREKDGIGLTLAATEAGLAAAGRRRQAPSDGDYPPTPNETVIAEPSTPPKIRSGTKQAWMIAMLRSPTGATVEEIAAATGWQPHTVRGAISGSLKKRLGFEVTTTKTEGRKRVYRVEI